MTRVMLTGMSGTGNSSTIAELRRPGYTAVDMDEPGWLAYDAIENLEIPDDLDSELDAYDAARENFASFPRSVKRGILEWIADAKRSATRRKRVEETARLAQENIRANQWRP